MKSTANSKPELFSYTFDFDIKVYENPGERFNYYQYLKQLNYRCLDKLSKTTRENLKYREDEETYILRGDAILKLIDQNLTDLLELEEKDTLIIRDFSVREGSLEISFSVFLLSAFINYGSLRQSLDYFEEDLKRLLSSTFPNNKNHANYYSLNKTRLSKTNSSIAKARRVFSLKTLLLVSYLLNITLLTFIIFKFSADDKASPPNVNNLMLKEVVREELRIFKEEMDNDKILKLLREINQEKTKENKKVE